jgi:hypothetical protein
MVEVESAELGVDQARAGGRGGVRGGGEGHAPRRKQAVAAMRSNQHRVRASTAIPAVGPQTQGVPQAEKESAELRGGHTE